MKQLLFFCFFIIISSNFSLYASEQPVRICNDSGEWAPYFYYERNSDGTKSDKLVGATVDALDAIFKIVGLKYSFELLPWKRCLAYVERFDKTQTYEMFSEAGINSKREMLFLHTEQAVYKRTDVFYYNNEKFPNGISIKTVKDMGKL